MAGGAAGMEKDVVLITGCSDGGIGAAMALEFAKAGYSVVATSRSVGSMKQLSSNEDIHLRAMDVTDYEGAKASVESILAEYGRIDILVNNAGVPCVAPVAEMPISLLESTFKTNVFGPVVLINAVVPHMVASGKGRIVNVGSVVSLCPGPLAGGYNSSKSAIEALTDALRVELRPFGIDVLFLMPGATVSNIGNTSTGIIRSEVFDNLKVYEPLKEQIMARGRASQNAKSTPTAEFAAKAVAYVLAKSPSAQFIYGRFATLTRILYFMPLWLRDIIWARYFNLNIKVERSTDKKSD